MSNNNIVIICPTCNNFVELEKLNCRIFRHGIFKVNGKQINPHAPKEECDFYINKQLIYGCGRPFIVVQENNTFVAKHCDYI